MNLKCRINSVDYDLVQGINFSEEYNETLDSGSIIITHVGRIENLNPYDDIYIWNSDEEFDGFAKSLNYDITCKISVREEIDSFNNKEYFAILFDKNLAYYENENNYINITFVSNSNTYNIVYKLVMEVEHFFPKYSLVAATTAPEAFQKLDIVQYSDIMNPDVAYYYVRISSDEAQNVTVSQNEIIIKKSIKGSAVVPSFFRHLLVDQFDEELINISKRIYKYKIELFSETKRLETIILPNVSITQPLNPMKKRSVYEYILQFVDMYSPVEKVAIPSLHNGSKPVFKFAKKYSLDSNLKEIFSNCYCPDFSLNAPSLRDVLNQLFIVKDRIPYVKNDVICALDITERKSNFNIDENKIVNIKGSRSSDNHFNNLRRKYENALSQAHSCRRVEYLGFRNSSNAVLTIDNMRLETTFPIYKINKIYMCYYKKGDIFSSGVSTNEQRIFLCKQDITPLVKLNSERNLLSQNWLDLNSKEPETIEELAQYKLCTVGYDIGSNLITGWGSKYTELINNVPWFPRDKTYIQNIATFMNNRYPYGIYNYAYIAEGLASDEIFSFTNNNDFFDSIVSPFSNDSLSLKSFIFIIDYEGFYSGAIIHSKDNASSDITMNDNSSASLTLLEKDGLYEKEKINRFGNKGITINCRYNNISELQELGSVFSYDGENDVIIYHREYSMFNNVINCVYYGTKDYVLKNYFTTVFAKYRTYNLMSYEESVLRAENKKVTLLLSTDECYYEQENTQFSFSDFGGSYIEKVLSFFKESPKAITKNYFNYTDRINYGYIKFNSNAYVSDLNVFVSGCSLCFNIRMFDNVSAGIYVDQIEPDLSDIEDDLKGSTQNYYLLVDDVETGFASKMGFYVCHLDQNTLFNEKIFSYNNSNKETINNIYKKLFAMPKVNLTGNENNIIGGEYIVNKDNKEQLDFTFQIEPVINNDNIMFSQWIMKLSDLISEYEKNDSDYTIKDISDTEDNLSLNIPVQIFTVSYSFVGNAASGTNVNFSPAFPIIVLKISENDYSKIPTGDSISSRIDFGVLEFSKELKPGINDWLSNDVLISFSFQPSYLIQHVENSYMVLQGLRVVKVDQAAFGSVYPDTFTMNMTFTKVSSLYNQPCEDGYIYFTNLPEIENNFDLSLVPVQPLQIIVKNKLFDITSYYFSNNKYITKYSTGDNIVEANSNVTNGYFSNGAPEITNYFKNMFVVLDNNPLKKSLVYDEYKNNNCPLNIDKSLKVSDFFSLEIDDKNIQYIKINLENVSDDINSIQYWYLERTDDNVEDSSGTYHFVFGANITNKDRQNGYIKINLSMLSTYDKTVYDVNHNIVGTTTNYASSNNGEKYGEDQYYDV